MFFDDISGNELMAFSIIYGVTAVVPLIAALYLLLRRGNAFAPEVTPPVRLRRWAAAFFGVTALSHVWWYILYALSGDVRSEADLMRTAGYMAAVVLDIVTLQTTIAGTLLAMLQDRRRPVWPVIAAMAPFVAMGVVQMVHPSPWLMWAVIAYVVLLYVTFTAYMAFAVRQYGRWLRDNYADLERKEVWLSHVLSLGFMLLLIFYSFTEFDICWLYLLHFSELVFFVFLLWRVETLSDLSGSGIQEDEETGRLEDEETGRLEDEETGIQEGDAGPSPDTLSDDAYEEMTLLLQKHCIDTGLYLQHDLNKAQVAQAIGTNRTYLSLYFMRQETTYNAYINDLRIRHFIRLYREAIAAERPVTAQQLALMSGYRSYSTFSLAFKQRMDQSVTTWMRREKIEAGKDGN